MSKVLKSKYNSTGERCVDACLNYGVLRYVKEDGSPISIEIPCDKYESAISDFEDRIKEGLTQREMSPKEILKRGSVTYNQAKIIAEQGKIKGVEFFEIDGSIECEHILGVSGSIEYALSLWNGETREEALNKATIRSIKIYGEEFMEALELHNTIDQSIYISFKNNIHTIDDILDIHLYKVKNYSIDNEIYVEELPAKQKITRNLDIPFGFAGAFIGFIIVQIATNFGSNLDNENIHIGLTILAMLICSLVMMKMVKSIKDKHVKSTNIPVMEMFNEELERASYENLLTKKEYKVILKNITKGEISKLLIDMKGSVNKKISSNTIVAKEVKFILEERKIIILPSEYEVNQAIQVQINEYKNTLG